MCLLKIKKKTIRNLTKNKMGNNGAVRLICYPRWRVPIIPIVIVIGSNPCQFLTGFTE
jgi:hypothetical protein